MTLRGKVVVIALSPCNIDTGTIIEPGKKKYEQIDKITSYFFFPGPILVPVNIDIIKMCFLRCILFVK